MSSRLDVGVASDEDPAPIGKAYRSKLQVILNAVCGVGIAAIALGSGFGDPVPDERPACLVIGSLASIWSVRVIRTGIYVRRDGLLVRAIAGTRLCRWEDIAGFDQLRANRHKNGAAYIAVRLNDGSHVKTAGLTGMRDRTFARVVLGELNEHLQTHRAGDASARDSPSNRPDDAREVT